jgi:hypothetical protein
MAVLNADVYGDDVLVVASEAPSHALAAYFCALKEVLLPPMISPAL